MVELSTQGRSCSQTIQILDWSYYIERLGSAVQKIITIPAALQGIPNPVPRVQHPEWLHKRLLDKNDVMKQKRITEMFKPLEKPKKDLKDIEDAGNITTTPKTLPAVVNTRKRTCSSKPNPNLSIDKEIFGRPPKFGGTKASRLTWLTFLKKKWAYQNRQKQDRKRGRTVENNNLMVRSKNFDRPTAAFGIEGFVQNSSRALAEMTWQILQIQKTNGLGLFQVWIMVGNDIRLVKLRVPRIFYLNLKIAKPNENTEVYQKVYRVLPRSNPSYNLYKYQVDEEQFQQRVNDLTAELSAPEVEGIYETQVPLLFRVLSDLGCSCRLLEKHGKAYLESDTFELGQLEPVPSSSRVDYLAGNNFKQMFLYSYLQDSRAVWVLFVVATKKANVWFLDASKTNNVPNLAKFYNAERSEKLLKVDGRPIPEADYQFQADVYSNKKEIYRNIQRTVRAYKDEKHGATLLSFISSMETDALMSLMPSLIDFPLIKIRISQHENMFNVLDWQRAACRSAFIQFLNFPTYFENYVGLCQYLRIPIGNVPKDFALFGADLVFARGLQKNNHVLWCSPGDRPDFGGKEVDDNRLVADVFESGGLNLNQPGLYTSFCVELEIASLPIAALLQATKIVEEEGISSAVGFDVGQQQVGIDEMVTNQRGLKFLAGYDETALCAPAFRILKSVVNEWVRDVANYSNKFADSLIVHFYRWLRSSNALLYEPALKKILNALMKKLFLLLIADLKRLGAVVVHATLSKIILCTKKRAYDDATTYVNFILSSVNKKDLFAPLDITIRQTWSILMWLDTVSVASQSNYGGIKVDDEENLNSDVNETVVEMNWNLQHFLPEIGECQSNFDSLVAGYIDAVRLEVEKQVSNPANASTLNSSTLNSSALGQTQTVAKNEQINDDVVTFCKKLMGEELTPKLANIVKKLQRKIMVNAGEVGVSELFPKLPGSYLKLTNPALEFAKTMCKVFSLDANVENEADNLKRVLLKCLNVGEFSDEAEWKDPCLSYVLPELICKFCNRCRDVDLCRDPFIYQEGDNELSRWRCDRCRKEYDVDEIEQILLQNLNKMLMSYCLQDLKCAKCRMIKQGHMNVRCECSGDFTLTMSLNDLSNVLKCFSNIARCYRMAQLNEALRFVSILNPRSKLLSL